MDAPAESEAALETQGERDSGLPEGSGHWVAAAFEQSLARALESMAGAEALADTAFHASGAGPEAWGAWQSPVWHRMTMEAVPGSALWAGGAIETVTALGQLVAGDPSLAEAECREAYVEVVNQTAAAAGDLISLRLGKRVSFSPCAVSEAPDETAFAVQIEVALADVTHRIVLVTDAALLRGLDTASAASQSASQSSGLPHAQSGADYAPARGQGNPAAPPPRNLDLLLEVELPVCVTFGRTQLPLKDVLKLSSGSIVELNRLANEPVEVLINDCVIARGEVVVVDGNYGIRVTEIVSRQERIRSIF